MWQTVAQISSGFALAAFLIAAVVAVLNKKSGEKADLIRTASEEDRPQLVQSALEFFHVDANNLSPTEQYHLALEQIRARQTRFKQLAVVVCLLALLATSLAAYAISRLPPSQMTPSSDQGSAPPVADSKPAALPPVAARVKVFGQKQVTEREYESFESDVDLRGYGPQRVTVIPGEGWEFDLDRDVSSRQVAGQSGTCYGVDLPASTSRGIVVRANNSSTRAGFPPERREGWVRCKLSAQRYRTTTENRTFELPEQELRWSRPLYIDLPTDRTSFIARLSLFDGTEVAVGGTETHHYFESSVVGDRLVIEPRTPTTSD